MGKVPRATGAVWTAEPRIGARGAGPDDPYGPPYASSPGGAAGAEDGRVLEGEL